VPKKGPGSGVRSPQDLSGGPSKKGPGDLSVGPSVINRRRRNEICEGAFERGDSELQGLNTLWTARIMKEVSEQGRKLGLDRSSEPNVPIGDFPMKGVPLRGRALSFLLQCLGSSYFALVSFPLSWLSASCLLLNSYGALFIDPSMQAFHKKMGEVPTPA